MVKSFGGEVLPVQDLRIGTRVLAARRSSGGSPNTLEVVAVTVHPEESQAIIKLSTRFSELLVTPSHRIMVQDERRVTAVLAGEVKKGQQLLSPDGAVELLHTQEFQMHTAVVEVCFRPDLAVEAFTPPREGILSKGQAHSAGEHAGEVARARPRTRRGGMWMRDQGAGGSDEVDLPSIPDTDTPYKD